MSSSISGLIFSTFSGQPLSILGATGPFLAYSLVAWPHFRVYYGSLGFRTLGCIRVYKFYLRFAI